MSQAIKYVLLTFLNYSWIVYVFFIVGARWFKDLVITVNMNIQKANTSDGYGQCCRVFLILIQGV